MVRMEGFDQGGSGQQPADASSCAVPVGVWGDSGAVPGTAGNLPQGTGTAGLPAGGSAAGHPLDSGNGYLLDPLAGSPEVLSAYSGTVATGSDGTARVELPGYCGALNRDFRYQLTVIGQFARAIIAEEVEDNAFTIRTDGPHDKVCWQVTGVHQGAWTAVRQAAAGADGEPGRSLHPEQHGASRGSGVPGGPGPAPEPHAVPVPVEPRAGGRRQLLLQDDPVDDGELRQLLSGARDGAEASAAAARARLKEQWGKAQEDLPEHPPGRP
ncbi:hypothetical protein HER39_06845 [Arthrobacter deserti]|uniref:Uncharacterized protein n=1 Tax=Arthrobacter deserti TaxID=1742687 RepID=A0ABX1JLV9_9MICC|nr:hypothetical protein [Arthrobacter deserti]